MAPIQENMDLESGMSSMAVTPFQENMDRESGLVQRFANADVQHEALADLAEMAKETVHGTFPQKGDSAQNLYVRVLCYACSLDLSFKDVCPSQQTCGSFCSVLCVRGHKVVGCKGESPYIRDDTTCMCVKLDGFVCTSSYKLCCLKTGCDLGDKVSNKCAKPRFVCCTAVDM